MNIPFFNYKKIYLSNKNLFNKKFISLATKGAFIMQKELEIFEKPEIIGSDEAKIKRVLINILSNSQKFTISGSITLTVKKEISNGIKYYKFSSIQSG